MRGRLRRVAWNQLEARPRLPVRLLLAVLVFVGANIAAVIALRPVFRALGDIESIADPTGGPPTATAVSLLVSTVVTLGVVYAVGRWIDQREFADFGFRFDAAWWRKLWVGLGLGVGLQTGIFVIGLVAGWIEVTGFLVVAGEGRAFWPWLVVSLIVFPPAALAEELLVRGYLLKNLAEGFCWFNDVEQAGAATGAILLSSAVFGIGHAANPNATLTGVLAIGLAGVMLGLAYVLTGELALPIGLHVSWNVAQGSLYGFPVSGTGFGVSVIGTADVGPRVMTGGAFGPEAGVLGILAILSGTLFILWWTAPWADEAWVQPGLTTPALSRQ